MASGLGGGPNHGSQERGPLLAVGGEGSVDAHADSAATSAVGSDVQRPLTRRGAGMHGSSGGSSNGGSSNTASGTGGGLPSSLAVQGNSFSLLPAVLSSASAGTTAGSTSTSSTSATGATAMGASGPLSPPSAPASSLAAPSSNATLAGPRAITLGSMMEALVLRNVARRSGGNIFRGGASERAGLGTERDLAGLAAHHRDSLGFRGHGVPTAGGNASTTHTGVEVAIHFGRSPATLTQRRERSVEGGNATDGEDSGRRGSDSAADDDRRDGPGPGHIPEGATRVELHSVVRWLQDSLPFMILLLCVLLRDNYMILVSFIWLTVGIFRVSSALQNQVALREERKPSTVLACLVLSSVHVALVYYGYRGEQLWRQLLLLPPATNLFFACLWRAAINDYLMRFLTVAVKSLLLLATKREPGRVNRRTATYMTAIEHSSLLYRSLLPMPVWYKFFLRDEVGQVFSSLVTGLYLTFKISAVFDRIAMTVAAMRALLRSDIHCGRHATPEEVMEAGDYCAICQGETQTPIMLKCSHIFCEECVSRWLEKEPTCPLCRAVIKSVGVKSYGNGATSMMFQVF